MPRIAEVNRETGFLMESLMASIAQAERRLIEATLQRASGDKRVAAEMLGVSLRTLYNRLNQYTDGGGTPAD